MKLDFEYHDTIQLDYQPRSIEASNTTIGICSSDKICFYDKKTKKLKKQYAGSFGRISLIDSHFYVFSGKPPNLYIFDDEGILTEKIGLPSNLIEDSSDGFLFSTEDNLLVLSKNGKKISKSKLQKFCTILI